METQFQTKLISTTFWAAPSMMFSSDMASFLNLKQYFWPASILFWLSFYAFIGLIYGMVQLSGHSKFATISALVATFGSLIGITIIGMSRLAWGLEVEGASLEMIRDVQINPMVFNTSRSPGLTFPIGLIMLVMALKQTNLVKPILFVGLLVSIVLFPVGRISGQVIFNVIGDGLMIVCFGIIGRIYRKRFLEVPEPSSAIPLP